MVPRITPDSELYEIASKNEVILPFLYWTGIRTAVKGKSIRDCCRESGLNEDFAIKFISTCLGCKGVKIDVLSSYSLIQLTELCKSSYAWFIKRSELLIGSLEEFSDKYLSTVENTEEGLLCNLRKILSGYRQILSSHYKILENAVLPHSATVYELYYSPDFTSERPDLLNYSIEFMTGMQAGLDRIYGEILDCINPAIESGRPEMDDLQSVYGFSLLHRELLVQDRIEQLLLKPLVMQMEDSIISTLQKKKRPVLRSNYLRLHEDIEQELLTQREKDVLALVALGYMNKETAEILGISMTTVITHRKNITAKLGIKSIPGLTVYAYNHGYIDDSILTNED